MRGQLQLGAFGELEIVINAPEASRLRPKERIIRGEKDESAPDFYDGLHLFLLPA